MPRKIIIDTDPGIDDAMAIFYALASSELEVIGITTVFGNVVNELCTINALRLLEIAERTDIPVAVGAKRPLGMPYHGGAAIVHGDDGQGNLFLPAPKTKPIDANAIQYLIDTITQSPEPITLVPIGPLTNIAMALILQPEITRNIAEIVLMGGAAFVPGNITPAAEANIFSDPEAAEIVFSADCPVTMIGLDVTEKVQMSSAQLAQIGQMPNPRAQHLAKIVPFYLEFYRNNNQMDAIHIHDSTTISYLLNPSLFESVERPIRVELQGIGRGKTWAGHPTSDDRSTWANRRLIKICVGANAEACVAMELERLAR